MIPRVQRSQLNWSEKFLVTDRTGLLPYRTGSVPLGKNRTVPVPVPYRTFCYIKKEKKFLTCHDRESISRPLAWQADTLPLCYGGQKKSQKIFPVYIVKRYSTVRQPDPRYGTAVPFAVLYGRTVRPYQGTVGHYFAYSLLPRHCFGAMSKVTLIARGLQVVDSTQQVKHFVKLNLSLQLACLEKV